MPPGVFASSICVVKGEALVVLESLLDVNVPVFLRRWLALLADDGLDFSGLSGNEGHWSTTGVGGVTKVVGVSTRFGGV